MNYNIKFSKKKDRYPIIAIVGCLHGDELVGKKVIDELKKVKLKKGTLITIIANEEAIKNKKRFIDQDLNRSFHGKENGTHEEKLAFDILKIVEGADFVLDIHSTITEVRDLIIITRKNKNILDLIKVISPKRVALMNKEIAQKAFINHCKNAISFEYGKDDCEKTHKDTLKAILGFLEEKGMVDYKKVKKNLLKLNFTR